MNKTLENTERGNEENGQSRETSNVAYNNMKYNTENEQDDRNGLHKQKQKIWSRISPKVNSFEVCEHWTQKL